MAFKTVALQTVKNVVNSVKHCVALQLALALMLILEVLIPVGIAAVLEHSWSPVKILKSVAVVKGCALPLQLLELGKNTFAAMASIMENRSYIERLW